MHWVECTIFSSEFLKYVNKNYIKNIYFTKHAHAFLQFLIHQTQGFRKEVWFDPSMKDCPSRTISSLSESITSNEVHPAVFTVRAIQSGYPTTGQHQHVHLFSPAVSSSVTFNILIEHLRRVAPFLLCSCVILTCLH